jgi:uncharacterized protein (TIGR00730 family)
MPERAFQSDADPMNQPPVVCVFCGARKGHDPRWVALARELGTALAKQGYTLLYGGGHVGLMGEVADAALAAGGSVIGVIPESLMRREVGHIGLTELEVVPDMHLRKQRMVARSDAFITLPGGLGTLDEVFEVLTLAQLGEHDRPMLIIDPAGYFDSLYRLLDEIVGQGFASAKDVQALARARSVAEALTRLAAAVPVLRRD